MHIRKARLEDSVELARLHRQTIRTVNSGDYPPEIIAAWSGRSTAKKFRDFFPKSIRIIAVENKQIIGFGELIKETGNLRAMYTHKDWLKKGVGTKIFERMVQEAQKLGVKRWEFTASIKSQPFYEAQGCKTIKPCTHRLRSGHEMEAYLMEYTLISE